MSTFTSEPGTRLAGRYRLVDQVNAGNGWSLWKAMDETLARPVSVLAFVPGFPRVAEAVTAARAASRLTDPRLAQVFDVEDSPDGAYVVMEWVAGDSLTDLLASGPLEPGRACGLIIDAARALAGAHAIGLAHLMLTPHSLRWTRTGGVKVLGLGIDAALAGTTLTGVAGEDPALADTLGLASLLYCALTGYWPGEEQVGLPPAPATEQGFYTPRQVSADIPPALDTVICRAMFPEAARHEPPIVTPAVFADAVSDVAPPVPLPEPVPMAWAPTGGFAPAHDPADPTTWSLDQRGGPRAYRAPRAKGSPAGRGVVGVVVVLVLAAIVAVGVMVSQTLGGGSTSSSSSASRSASQSASAATSTALKPVSVSTYNVFGTPSGNNEDPANAPLAIDGNPSTAWATQWYQGSPKMGGLKPGTGLLLDMGRSVRLSQVQVNFGTQCCTNATIYLGNDNSLTKAAFGTFTQVSSAANVSGTHTFEGSSATGRYLLVWLTSLPPALPSSGAPTNGNYYQGTIYNVAVTGTPATAP